VERLIRGRGENDDRSRRRRVALEAGSLLGLLALPLFPVALEELGGGSGEGLGREETCVARSSSRSREKKDERSVPSTSEEETQRRSTHLP